METELTPAHRCLLELVGLHEELLSTGDGQSLKASGMWISAKTHRAQRPWPLDANLVEQAKAGLTPEQKGAVELRTVFAYQEAERSGLIDEDRGPHGWLLFDLTAQQLAEIIHAVVKPEEVECER
jgi:hypothetical protein